MLSSHNTPENSGLEEKNMRDTIQHVLIKRFSPQDTEVALAIWDEGFRDSVRSGQLSTLIAYTQEISEYLELDRNRAREIQLAVFRALRNLNVPDGKAVPVQSDKWEETPAKNDESQHKPGLVSYALLKNKALVAPEMVIFIEVGKRMIEGAQRVGYKEFEDFTASVADHLQSSKLPDLAQQNLLNWCSHKGAPVQGSINDKDLGKAINVFYIALCEAVGPAGADAILASAIRNAEKLPEARLFPPKRLL